MAAHYLAHDWQLVEPRRQLAGARRRELVGRLVVADHGAAVGAWREAGACLLVRKNSKEPTSQQPLEISSVTRMNAP